MCHYAIVEYTDELESQVNELFQACKAQNSPIVFWHPGPPSTWEYVLCLMKEDRLIAKGQTAPIFIAAPGSPREFTHQIYINMKIHPDFENDQEARETLYKAIYNKAKKLKKGLTAEYKTKLMAGNFSTEWLDNQFLTEKGLAYEFSLFQMKRNLDQEIKAQERPFGNCLMKEWKMESEEEEKRYLKANADIWPEASLSLTRLREAKSKQEWRTITAFSDQGQIIGSVMVWIEDGHGVTEDIFVHEEWRKQGYAKYLISTALKSLKSQGVKEVYLEVEAKNHSALKLYHLLGYKVMNEQCRFGLYL